MTAIGESTTSAIAAVPALHVCDFCGRPLETTEVVVGGTVYEMPCYGSCGCSASYNRMQAMEGRGQRPAADRYRRAGIGGRFMDATADLGDYPQRVAAGESLYLFGPNGVRKTGFASALARELVDMGLRVDFENCRDVMTAFTGDGRERLMARMASCDVLFLDDLGKEQPTAYAVSMLYGVVDVRYRDARPIVATSNFSRGELAERWAQADRPTAESIVSRLCDGVEAVRFDGDDSRVA